MTPEPVFLSTYASAHLFAFAYPFSQSYFMLSPNIHTLVHKTFEAVYIRNLANVTGGMIYLQHSHFAHSVSPEIPSYTIKKYFLHSKQPMIAQVENDFKW